MNFGKRFLKIIRAKLKFWEGGGFGRNIGGVEEKNYCVREKEGFKSPNPSSLT
jgi:hypothetical protein